MSIHLGRRQITHVILGKPCGSGESNGAGGGLAATKIQKEIKTIRGCGVKYVGVEWYAILSNVTYLFLTDGTKCRVLESIKSGKRFTRSSIL